MSGLVRAHGQLPDGPLRNLPGTSHAIAFSSSITHFGSFIKKYGSDGDSEIGSSRLLGERNDEHYIFHLRVC